MLTQYAAIKLAGSLQLSPETVADWLETPPSADWGDVAFPCFQLAKTRKAAPAAIARQLAQDLQIPGVRVEARGPYVNLFFDRSEFGTQLMKEVLDETFGKPQRRNGQRVVIDMSSPNIAKPFGIGHLRSTVIGNSLYRLYEAAGYRPISVNHLGDWGTQFGKQIAAYKRWGDPETLAANPIRESLKLYVRFHDETENQPELEDEAREWFRKLEEGDEEANRLWRYFVQVSMEEFDRMYAKLGVTFDHVLGESFYNDKMDAVIQQLRTLGLLEESDGAQVVRLDEEGLPPCLILKSDGTTIYPTRDLATAIYRHEHMQGERLLYVVGSEQSLHFQQVFAVLRKMGFEWAQHAEHIPFGLMRFGGQKMSTRRGRVVMLDDVLAEAVARALAIINEKHPALPDKERAAEAIGIGAIIFGDLKNDRRNNVDFSLEEALKFEGETGPYVQYTYARTQSVLGKANGQPLAATDSLEYGRYLSGDAAWALLGALHAFPQAIVKAVDQNEPSVIARYLLEVSKLFNKFYHAEKILTDDADERQCKLALTATAGNVLRQGLYLLGIQAPTQI